MVIKRELTTEEYNNAPDQDKSLYSQQGESYVFVAENAGELRRGKARLHDDYSTVVRERDELSKKLQEIEKAKDEATHQKVVDTSDVKKLDETWKAKYSKLEAEQSKQISELKTSIVNSKRNAIINELSSTLVLPEYTEVMKSVLRERVGISLDEKKEPQVVVFDDSGKATHDTIKDLTKALKADKRYNRLLKGSEEKGSGASIKPQNPSSLPPFGEMSRPEPVNELGKARQQLNNLLNANPTQLEKIIGNVN